jgi:hypothetical protein
VPASQLLGGEVRFWHDQIFYKPAHHGGVVIWHQDYSYWTCSFHHPLMVHGSFENRTERPRRAAVINAFRDGVRSASNEPLLQGVPPILAGEKLRGQFFPLLFDPHQIA